MNPMVSTVETPIVNSHIGSMELLGRNSEGEEFPVSTMSVGLTSSPFGMFMSDDILTSDNQMGESESMSNHFNFQQYSGLNCEAVQPSVVYPSLGEEKLTIQNKRKATAELTANHSLQNMPISNKRPAQVGLSAEDIGMSQLITKKSRSPRPSVSNKKNVWAESSVKKPQSILRYGNMQSGVSSGTEAVITDPVRIKLRESLTAALALVLEKKESSLDTDKTGDVAVMPTDKAEQPATIVPASVDSTNTTSAGECSGSSGSQEALLKDLPGDDWKFVGQDFQTNPIFPGEDAPFGDSLYFRDELLQGNGLSWAMEFDAQIAEMHVVESTVEAEKANEDADMQEKEPDMSPESVATKIESELFTLFGGVNKKYKEKGRSLLFNLKDHNNPELRERVMSGEISPERLCKMTAEELASKELSQWRMAKAEELDQMKVLPDSDINVRRLVKKTHKGEYQVDFDQDTNVVEDVPANVSIARDNARKKTSGGVTGHQRKGDGAKGHEDGQCTITIPGDGTDMHGLMVDDMRDLPPILSLDEFMESLDKEPPFESLPADSVNRTPDADNETSDGVIDRSPVLSSKDPVGSTSVISEEVDVKSELSDVDVITAENHRSSVKSIVAERTKKVKEEDVETVQCNARVNSTESQRVPKANVVVQNKVEYLWQGLLQLTLTSTAYVNARYKSGEKTSTKNWPGFVEIKGRVRLDAFDKFLQELPKSRTRATMVVHFTLAEQCTDEERCNLIDLVDTYVADQRLGYAEPAPGLELYLCPPRSKTVDMIVTHLPKGYTEELRDIENGLVGILVWRKERVPAPALPNASSQQKPVIAPITAGQHSISGRQLPDKDAIRNVRLSGPAMPPPPTSTKPALVSNDDEAPPGFGPPSGARDDDDLPEFNFSGGSHPSRFPASKVNNPTMAPHHRPEAPSRQVEQMRELIQKYGKGGSNNNNSINGIPIQPWNDDDDDIPEWQPQGFHPHRQPPNPLGFHTQAHVLSRPPFQPPVAPLVKPMLPPQPMTQGAWRHPGPNMPHPSGSPRSGAQFYRAPVPGHKSRDRRPPNAFNRGRGY